MILCPPDLVVDVSYTRRLFSLLCSIGIFPGSTGPKRLTSKGKMLKQHKKLHHLPPEHLQDEINFLIFFVACYSLRLHPTLSGGSKNLSTSDFHMGAALIYLLQLFFSHVFLSWPHIPLFVASSISLLPCRDKD